ncbi:hypothetical protein, partial [Alkalibacillus haloalkaliphilus]|uniref:hypothetical protein n=1 Tax=Alkalibacillus haloalkaliphilus TaxID=94136 RepID=UPI00293603A4
STKEEKGDIEKTASDPASYKPPKSSWFRRKATKKPKYDSSLFLALHRTFLVRIWAAGIFKFCAGVY